MFQVFFYNIYLSKYIVSHKFLQFFIIRILSKNSYNKEVNLFGASKDGTLPLKITLFPWGADFYKWKIESGKWKML